MSWRVCSSCRSSLDYGQVYWECSVSTCTRKRTGLFFCSVSCWEAHLPEARHREAWAVEKKAPTREKWQAQLAEEEAKEATRSESAARRTVSPTKNAAGQELPRDVLVVVTKIKKYIKARSGLNTSDGVMELLSDELRRICDRAIRVAEGNVRKTVLDRDMREALKAPPSP